MIHFWINEMQYNPGQVKASLMRCSRGGKRKNSCCWGPGTDTQWELCRKATRVKGNVGEKHQWCPPEAETSHEINRFRFYVVFLVRTKHQLRERIQEPSPRSWKHPSPCPPRRDSQDRICVRRNSKNSEILLDPGRSHLPNQREMLLLAARIKS